MKSISVKLIIQNRKLSDGLYAIALRITKNRKKKEIGLGFKCKKDEFINQEFTKKHEFYKTRNRILAQVRLRALSIIDKFEAGNIDFSLEDFENAFTGKKNECLLVFNYFEERIEDETKAGKIGNAKVYKDAMNGLYRFCKNKNLRFEDVNVSFLEKYEVFLRQNSNQDAGISIKMRQLRALFNSAIRKGLISKELYPFDNYKISKLKGNSNKRALNLTDMKKILNINLSQFPNLLNSYNYFIFSYYTRGMNFMDMMKLKWTNIEDDKIIYIRSKTKTRFVIKILPPVFDILAYYKASNKSGSSYVFPILLKDNLTPVQIENRKTKMLKKYNRDLKEIALLAEIDKKITSYVARHSYATNLKFLGVSTDVISQSMGHSNVSITATYLNDFEDNMLDNENEKLLNI